MAVQCRPLGYFTVGKGSGRVVHPVCPRGLSTRKILHRVRKAERYARRHQLKVGKPIQIPKIETFKPTVSTLRAPTNRIIVKQRNVDHNGGWLDFYRNGEKIGQTAFGREDVGLGYEPGTAKIDAFEINPELRGQHLGGEAWKAAEAELAKLGFEHLRLLDAAHTEGKPEGGSSFWKRQGFTVNDVGVGKKDIVKQTKPGFLYPQLDVFPRKTRDYIREKIRELGESFGETVPVEAVKVNGQTVTVEVLEGPEKGTPVAVYHADAITEKIPTRTPTLKRIKLSKPERKARAREHAKHRARKGESGLNARATAQISRRYPSRVMQILEQAQAAYHYRNPGLDVTAEPYELAEGGYIDEALDSLGLR